MWTNNGLKFLSANVLFNICENSDSITFIATDGTSGQHPITNTSILSSTTTPYDLQTETPSYSTGISMFNLLVGSDDTPAALDDYKLGNFISTLTMGTQTCEQSGTGSFTTSRILTNSTSENITVKEIGVYCKCGNGSTQFFMVAHKILDTPIVIEPNKSKVVSYQLDFTKLND